MDLQADSDVHGACYIHRSADICPCIFWGGFLYVQTAITPQEHPPIKLSLCRRKITTFNWEHGDYLCNVLYVSKS